MAQSALRITLTCQEMIDLASEDPSKSGKKDECDRGSFSDMSLMFFCPAAIIAGLKLPLPAAPQHLKSQRYSTAI